MATAERTTYDPYTVPEAPGGSRFFLAQTPAGWAKPPAETVAHIYRTLFVDRQREAPSLTNRVTVKLSMIALVGGEYVVRLRGEVAAEASVENRRPGQRWRQMTGGACLDSFVLGGAAFKSAPDLEVWEAAREVAEVHKLDGKALRELNDLTAALVALRAGVAVTLDKLPYPRGMVRG